MKKTFLILFASMMAASSLAQSYVEYTTVNDKSKTLQVKSLEAVHWNFHPGLYYVTLHKKYSGGSWQGLHIKFRVSKSDVGWVSTQRVAAEAQEALAEQFLQQQIDSIKPLVEEERTRFAERSIDASYDTYSSELDENFLVLDDFIQRISSKGVARMSSSIASLTEDTELLRSEVKYIHKDITAGSGNEMEQTKRALAYENVLKKQQQLITRASKLLRYALAHQKE